MALVVMVPKEAPTCATSAFSISPLSFPVLIHAGFWGFSFPSTPPFLPFSSSSLLICACGISLQAARYMLEQGGIPAGGCTDTNRIHPFGTGALMLQEHGSSWG